MQSTVDNKRYQVGSMCHTHGHHYLHTTVCTERRKPESEPGQQFHSLRELEISDLVTRPKPVSGHTERQKIHILNPQQAPSGI